MTNTSTETSHPGASTPSRPITRTRHAKSSPQVPTIPLYEKRRNPRGKRANNPNNTGQNRPKPESALTKKFREAAQQDQGTASDSAMNSVVNEGLVTPPATPGPAAKQNPAAHYVSDSAVGMQTEKGKKKNKKKDRKRPTDITTTNIQTITPPQQPSDLSTTPPNDLLLGKATPSKAYAGACFHSSPAPNALPLPKFFSKSVPSTSDGPSLSKMLAEAEAAGLPDASNDSPPQTAPLASGTPLDLLFKADKEEKARKALHNGNMPSPALRPEFSRPQPIAFPSYDNQPHRDITPPSTFSQNTLGSPFEHRSFSVENRENSSDLLFSMDFSEPTKSVLPSAAEVVIGQRFRPLSDKGYDPETLQKRHEKAKALKAVLMSQQSMDAKRLNALDGPPSPSPKPKSKTIAVPPMAEKTGPASPTPFHERRSISGNVGFAPAPRIRHFNQNRPVNPRHNGHQKRNHSQSVVSPTISHPHTSTNSQGNQAYDQERARVAENFVRGVLKLDTPIPAN
jgi:hypothetical protein